MITMKALRPHPLRDRSVKTGDIYQVDTEQEAAKAERFGLSRKVVIAQTSVDSMPDVADAAEPRTKRQYRRRDLSAQS